MAPQRRAPADGVVVHIHLAQAPHHLKLVVGAVHVAGLVVLQPALCTGAR